MTPRTTPHQPGELANGHLTKRTPERAVAVANALRAGATRIAAAAHAGLDQNTFYRWLAADPAFKATVLEAESAAEIFYSTKVYQAASKGDSWQAAAWWLERRRSSEYGRRDRLELVNVREAARLVAAQDGLDPDEVLAEAERIVAASSGMAKRDGDAP